MMRRLSKLIATAFFTCTLSLPAFALSLDEAKANGQVGEQSDGYLGAVNASSSTEVKALISEINAKRKALYQQKATKAGVAPQVMEQRTGERLQQMAPTGEYIRQPDGRWVKK